MRRKVDSCVHFLRSGPCSRARDKAEELNAEFKAQSGVQESGSAFKGSG